VSRTEGGLDAALDNAIAGDDLPLETFLARVSGLPGLRPNLGFLDTFAKVCCARGIAADGVIARLVSKSAAYAPGATSFEFLPMAGVAALAARGAADPTMYPRALAGLHASADDLRFRVRDRVVVGLTKLGASQGQRLVDDTAGWMDGYFHAAAVISALADSAWLAKLETPSGVLGRLDEGFVLARDATRAAWRYPGHKALVEALGATPSAVGLRFGVPLFDLLVGWSTTREPALREVVAKCAALRTGRLSEQVQRLQHALEATEEAPRDPRTVVGPTRQRGAKRRK
jgi:hypothetical protein